MARINQDARVYTVELTKDQEIDYRLDSQRHAWLHVIRGTVKLNGISLRTGDAAAVDNEARLALIGSDAEPSEILLFDLA